MLLVWYWIHIYTVIQVDIFSFGITLYELMTLDFLPPLDVDHFEFDSDIKDGIRPSFLDEVTS